MTDQATPARDMTRRIAAPARQGGFGYRSGRLKPPTWWLWPVSIFVVTRCVSGLMIMIAQQHQIAITQDEITAGYYAPHPTDAQPGYFGVASNWDAQWYWQIAEHGYPATLPVDASGHIERSAWAFPPLFPFLARALMTLTGLGFPPIAVAISVCCSLLAVLVIHHLIEETAGLLTARVTTLLLCTSMAAPVLQIGYTEGPALLLIAMALWQLREGNYARTALLLFGLGLTRHVVIPFLVVLAVHAACRWRDGMLTPMRQVALVALGLATVVSAAAWPLTVALATGRLTAFTDTQANWRMSTGVGPFGIFSVGWHMAGFAGLGLGMLIAISILGLVLRPGTRAWSPEVRAWAAAYPLYVLAVAPAAISLIRFMILAFPLAWAFPGVRTASKTRAALVVVLAIGGLLAQWYWIRHFLVLGPLEEQFAMP